MGCLLSKGTPEAIALVQSFNESTEKKRELLYTLDTLKINQHLKSKYPDLNHVKQKQVSIETLSAKLKEFQSGMKQLKNTEEIQELAYDDSFNAFDELIDSKIFEEMKNQIKMNETHIKSLKVKLKEMIRIKKEIEANRLTSEELVVRKENLVAETVELNEKLVSIKENILTIRDYIESRKKRRRRFTIRTLPPKRVELRTKILMKQELIKKIEVAKQDLELSLIDKNLSNAGNHTPSIRKSGNIIRNFKRFVTAFEKPNYSRN